MNLVFCLRMKYGRGRFEFQKKITEQEYTSVVAYKITVSNTVMDIYILWLTQFMACHETPLSSLLGFIVNELLLVADVNHLIVGGRSNVMRAI